MAKSQHLIIIYDTGRPSPTIRNGKDSVYVKSQLSDLCFRNNLCYRNFLFFFIAKLRSFCTGDQKLTDDRRKRALLFIYTSAIRSGPVAVWKTEVRVFFFRVGLCRHSKNHFQVRREQVKRFGEI